MHKIILKVIFVSFLLFVLATSSSRRVAFSQANEWTVSVMINDLYDITDNDAYEGYDFYFHIVVSTGFENWTVCDNEDNHSEDDYHITPNWTCSLNITGANPRVYASILVFDQDSPSENDQLDIHPKGDTDQIDLWFWPATHRINIVGRDDDGDGIEDEDENGNGEVEESEDSRCAIGRITMQGEQGVDRAKIVFTATATVEGANNGDSDNDGLTDAAERCGLDTDSDGNIDVDLPGMGADPFRKDLFVETDWMVDSDGIPPLPIVADHSHEPWLPALINTWHELDQAPVTNPPAPDGVARPGGIALHVDVGTLYANYTLDINNDGLNVLSVDATGNVCLDSNLIVTACDADDIPDIGNLSALGSGTPGGGNRICADLTPAPCAAGRFGEVTQLSPANASLIRANNFMENRAHAFRYVVFAHLSNPGGNSGWSPYGDLDFIVSLGAFPNQGGGLVGPTGLPVSGKIGEHTGTFLHELGHSLGLCHGGPRPPDLRRCDNADPNESYLLNNKPNYISIMNYNYQLRGVTYSFDGDTLAEPLTGFDFDQDGLPDNQRFIYSMDSPASEDNVPFTGLRGGLPPLQETALDEPEGVGDGQALVFYGPSLDLNGDGLCDVCTLTAIGNQPIDWNRAGDFADLNVTHVSRPPQSARHQHRHQS